MRWLIIIILILSVSSASSAFTLNLSNENNLVYDLEVLPAGDLQSISTNLSLFYPVKDKGAISIDYLSIGGLPFASQSYTVSYRLYLNLQPMGIIHPSALIGYRFIDTPATGLVTPIDLGILSEIEITPNAFISFPLIVSLFSKDNLLDYKLSLINKNNFFGDFEIGVRNLRPFGTSNFSEKLLLVFGIINQL